MDSMAWNRAPTLKGCRNPHTQSWCPASLAWLKHIASSLLEELLGHLVERSALLDSAEPLDLQSGTCLLDGGNPWVLLGKGAPLLAHDTAGLGLGDLACEGMAPGELCGDHLLLHGLHGLGRGGLHGFHCLHCLGHFEDGSKDLGRVR